MIDKRKANCFSGKSRFCKRFSLRLAKPMSTQAKIRTDVPEISTADRAKSDLASVLHVINGEHYSGAERVQDLLGNRLPEFGFEASFACVKPGLFPTKRKFHSPSVFNLPMKHRFDFSVARKIADLIKQQDACIVHAHTPRSAMVAAMAARKMGVPFVYHVHSPVSRDSTRWLVNRFNQWVEAWALRRATKIVTVSDSLKDYMLGLGFDEEKVVAIPNGVPVNDAPMPKSSRKSLTIGTVALFRPRKGTEVLIEALANLRRSGVDANVLAVGPFEKTSYENELKALADRLGVSDHIKWTGFCDRVEPHFADMDLFVLPSLFGEGLPMVVLEAMANRTPIIASNVEGIPQAIRNGVDGLIVKAGDPSELANQLTLLAHDRELREQFGESALDRQRECFSDVSMASKMSVVYKELM